MATCGMSFHDLSWPFLFSAQANDEWDDFGSVYAEEEGKAAPGGAAPAQGSAPVQGGGVPQSATPSSAEEESKLMSAMLDQATTEWQR